MAHVVEEGNAKTSSEQAPVQPSSSSKVKVLVVDTAALLENLRLDHFADELLTIPEVLAEVRNETSRRQLSLQPFELKLRQPSPEALKFVVEFSKKTGDFASLSAVDLRVLALTYMLEKELAGDAHLRKAPEIQTVFHQSAPQQAVPRTELPGFYSPKSTTPASGRQTPQLNHDDSPVQDNEGTSSEQPHDEDAMQEVESNQHDHDHDHQSNEDNDDSGWTAVPMRSRPQIPDDTIDSIEDDNEGWITPSNVDELKAKHAARRVRTGNLPVPSTHVACITADFAMQNVLLQIGIRIQDINGRIIEHAKTWVLRCHACYKSTRDLSRKFCPQCGNNTLIRTSVSIGADGVVQYHLKANFNYNLRGTKYPIPDSKGGRTAKNLVLREDQKEFDLARRVRREKKVDVFEQDYIPAMHASEGSQQHRLGGGSSTLRVGYGRKNPNEQKHHTGKKKSAK